MSNFKESLYEKKSFIYQIGDMYYAIGANTFAKVTDAQELDNMELFQNALKRTMTDKSQSIWINLCVLPIRIVLTQESTTSCRRSFFSL